MENAETRPAVFCAGGIGISPVLCQYQEYLSQRADHAASSSKAPALFLYSVSTQEELVFAEELAKLVSKSDNPLDKMIFTLTKQSSWKPTSYQKVELTTGRILSSLLDAAPTDSIYFTCVVHLV